METTLFLAHTEADGSLGKIALESLGAAKELAGDSLVAGVIGENTSVAASLPASRVFTITGTEFAQARYATDAAAAEAVCRTSGAAIVIAPATSRWARALPGVAHRLGGRADTHVTGIVLREGKLFATRWYYRQRMEGTFERSGRPWVLLLESGCHAPWSGAAGAGTVEAVEVPLAEASRRTAVQGVQEPQAGQQTIRPDAELLFVTGAGWTKAQRDRKPHVKEAETLILEFLANTQASLGSSKSLVDISGEGQQVLEFLTHMNQVGQTGSTPRHPKGLATCCHGEEP
ncbi:MAG TPA: electron transfer flavoprotein subunit alpha, partial [Bryobacteraceae bacterium]|nr:electron transfer flavoprotein subunit alpha [Bryobacteraceae bacterium]